MSRYGVLLEKKAFKQLEKMSKDARNRMIEALHVLRDEGSPQGLTSKNCEGTENSTGFG